MTLSSWYFGSWDSVYFDILFRDSKLQRFKVIVKPDLSDASLQFINTSEITSDDLMKFLEAYRDINHDGYRICEDALVNLWNNSFTSNFVNMSGAYTGLTSAPFTNIVTRWDGEVDSLCPTSGRFVYCTDSDDGDGGPTVIVADFLL
jgi:hypothetical protein